MLTRILAQFLTYFLFALLFITIGVLLPRTELFDRFLTYLESGSNGLELMGYTGTLDASITTWTDAPEKAHDGLLLIAGSYLEGPAVILMDHEGNTLHQWSIPKAIVNPETHARYDTNIDVDDTLFAVVDAVLYPNGDLIAIQNIPSFMSYKGQRIVRLDKDSNLLWENIGTFHHYMDALPDGTVYALSYALRETFPIVAPQAYSHTLYLEDVINVISPQGDITQRISVVDAFDRSDYRYLIDMSELDVDAQTFDFKDGTEVFDFLHANSIDYLNATTAVHIPYAQEGDLLISLRGMSALAVLRPSTETIVWAARGAWRHQHFATATEDGKLYIYDNDGGFRVISDEDESRYETQPRLVEFSPSDGATTVLYRNTDYHSLNSFWGGAYQALDNGTFLFCSPEKGRILQVDPANNQIIWELRTIADRNKENVPYTKKINHFRYYDASHPSFLN